MQPEWVPRHASSDGVQCFAVFKPRLVWGLFGPPPRNHAVKKACLAKLVGSKACYKMRMYKNEMRCMYVPVYMPCMNIYIDSSAKESSVALHMTGMTHILVITCSRIFGCTTVITTTPDTRSTVDSLANPSTAWAHNECRQT